MRRKTYDLLFDTDAGMAVITRQSSLWRSYFYFALSIGFFTSVITNTWLIHMPLDVRFGIILATLVILGTVLNLYGFLIHGLLETYGAVQGDCKALICLLGYTTLPFLVLTAPALLFSKMGVTGLPFLIAVILIGFIWMIYLLIRSIEAIYLINGIRATVTVLFSLLLLYVVLIFPWQVIYHLGIRFLTGL